MACRHWATWLCVGVSLGETRGQELLVVEVANAGIHSSMERSLEGNLNSDGFGLCQRHLLLQKE